MRGRRFGHSARNQRVGELRFPARDEIFRLVVGTENEHVSNCDGIHGRGIGSGFMSRDAVG